MEFSGNRIKYLDFKMLKFVFYDNNDNQFVNTI